jgi:hypothetical protein
VSELSGFGRNRLAHNDLRRFGDCSIFDFHEGEAMEKNVTADTLGPAEAPTSTCIDWYSEGETRVVEVDGVRVVVRFVGRKGRRGRIVIEAPAGAVFSSAPICKRDVTGT